MSRAESEQLKDLHKMKPRPRSSGIHVGDGIITHTGKRGIVRALIFPGYVEGTPTTDDRTVIGVRAEFEYGMMDLKVQDFRRETFTEYLTRPTGFGKTPWPLFIILQAICLYGIAASVISWGDGGWIGFALVMLTEGALILGTRMNYTRRWV